MTDKQWRAATARAMFKTLPKDSSPRKLRLFVCACWREYHRQWVIEPKGFDDPAHMARLLKAAEAGEVIADGGTAAPPGNSETWYSTMDDVHRAARESAADKILGRRHIPADLLRDIFANPARPVAFAPEWRTDTAVAIAQGMYESRDFSAMPILADALQDSGCESAAVLDHCRAAPAPHVRGCWVVDLVLGKQ